MIVITHGVAMGIGHGIDGREAARQAALQALAQLGSARPGIAIILAAQEYPMGEVFAGLSSPSGRPACLGNECYPAFHR